MESVSNDGSDWVPPFLGQGLRKALSTNTFRAKIHGSV